MTMSEKSDPHGHFQLDRGLPDNDYYSFTDGEISVTVERGGGINDVGCLDILNWKGKLYPDREETPVVFRKQGSQCGKRPAYGPAVQFISTHTQPNGRPGRNLFHVPDEVELYPFGFRSSSHRFGQRTTYDLAIDGRDILFSFGNTSADRRDLVTCIDKNHIFKGAMHSLKNQLAAIPPTVAEDAAFLDDPHGEQRWNFIGFDPHDNAFVMEGVMQFPYGHKGIVVMIAADRKLTLTDTKQRYLLSGTWGRSRRFRMCLVVAASRDEAKARATAALKGISGRFTRKIRQAVGYAEKATQMRADDYPDVHAFGCTAPSFLRSMVLAETDHEACIRAANHHFGFFHGWDQIWPANAFVLMGDWPLAKKLLRYQITCPQRQMARSDQSIVNLINTIGDAFAVSGDRAFLDEMYPHMKALFSATHARANRQGLIPGPGFSVDDPQEVEQIGQILCPDLNGWWYGACRTMENLALLIGDRSTARQAGETAKRIEAAFMDIFYDPAHGYFYIGVAAETGKGIPVFHNVMTLGMDAAHGAYLFRSRTRELAEFQAYQLFHPAGRSAVAYWDRADEMWHSCIMFQHITHELRLARAAGMGEEIDRLVKVYLGLFATYRTARETHNFVGCHGDSIQKADWQGFGTRALYSGLFEGLIGIQCDLGGFGYVPCDLSGEMAISGFHFRRGRWAITIKGQGAGVRRFIIDGNPLAGSLKVPGEFLRDARSHTLVIERGNAPCKGPVLLAAADAPLCDVIQSKGVLAFGVEHPVHANFKIACQTEPRVTYAGAELPFQWDPAGGAVWVDACMEPGGRLTVKA